MGARTGASPAGGGLELVAIPGNAIPQGMTCRGLKTRDGVMLRYAEVRLPQARGTVVIVPGRGDFIERYFETARDMLKRGYAVALFDLRGQGGSDRPLKDLYRSLLPSFSAYDTDLATVMREAVLPHLPPPYVALGHSTGSHVVLRALRREPWFSRAVLSAPLLGVHTGRWPLWTARVLSSLFSLSGLGWVFLPGQLKRPLASRGFDGNAFTSDPVRFRRDTALLERQPGLGLGGPTFSWLRAALASMDELMALRRRDSLKAPVLIVAAGADRIVDTRAARAFASGVAGVSFLVIEGARHELLAEHNCYREQFLAAFDAFVEAPPRP